MAAADGCVFCGLIAGELEASIVYEEPRAVALMDIQPLTTGHMLVMPRRHSPSLAELDPDDGATMFRVAQLAAAALRGSGLRCEGINLFLADGAAAGQDVFHVHLHVFPRFEGDGFGLRFPPEYQVRPRAELDVTASALRKAWPPGRASSTSTQAAATEPPS
jgi:histidine triad (HIT) family protein